MHLFQWLGVTIRRMRWLLLLAAVLSGVICYYGNTPHRLSPMQLVSVFGLVVLGLIGYQWTTQRQTSPSAIGRSSR